MAHLLILPPFRLIVTAMTAAGHAKQNPRTPSSLGIASYDGNIVGGALLGAGMAISGSCPGTVLAQVGVGLTSGLYSLQGAFVGGVLWSGFLKRWIASRSTTTDTPGVLTIHEQSGVSKATAFVGLETLFALGILAIQTQAPLGPSVISPVVGGLLIGLSQLISLVLRKSMLGVSTSYEEVGNYFWWVITGGNTKNEPSSHSSIVFSTGVVMGAWALATTVPSLGAGTLPSGVQPLGAFIGGLLICLGARVAGGCTSGHGISGIALLSTASFITVMSMFSAAILTFALVN
jgi:uncharacterized membrane protein YedE/YeeE